MKNTLFISLILITCLFSACDDSEGVCTTDMVSRVNAGLYVRDSMGERDTLLSSFIFYGAMRPDSLIYDDANDNSIVFPLPNSTEEFTSFVLRTGILTDTLHIYHNPSLVLVSFVCGFTTSHNIHWVQYENIIIDTVVISDPLVDLEDYENLKIYIKPTVADTSL